MTLGKLRRNKIPTKEMEFGGESLDQLKRADRVSINEQFLKHFSQQVKHFWHDYIQIIFILEIWVLNFEILIKWIDIEII